jgi:hypothetical protein
VRTQLSLVIGSLATAITSAGCANEPEGSSSSCVFYLDLDGDGHGDPLAPVETCETDLPIPLATSDDDCDDGTAFVNPDQPELCDGLDNDCDGHLETVCPPGCHPDPDWLVQGVSRYLICSTALTWNDARNVCRAHGFDLASVDDYAEDTELWSHGQIELEGRAFHLGGTDADHEGFWRWVDSGTELWRGDSNGTDLPDIWANWQEGSPDDAFENEDCLSMSQNAMFPAWSDGSCAIRAPFICERE